jgi:toxin ParE1/3/4
MLSNLFSWKPHFFLVFSLSSYKYLVNFPKIGKRYQSLRADLRGISFSGYIIFYRANEDIVEILRVVNGSRDLEALFADL